MNCYILHLPVSLISNMHIYISRCFYVLPTLSISCSYELLIICINIICSVGLHSYIPMLKVLHGLLYAYHSSLECVLPMCISFCAHLLCMPTNACASFCFGMPNAHVHLISLYLVRASTTCLIVFGLSSKG